MLKRILEQLEIKIPIVTLIIYSKLTSEKEKYFNIFIFIRNLSQDRRLYKERLKIQFPKVSSLILNKHDDIISKKFFFNQKKKAIQREIIREK